MALWNRIAEILRLRPPPQAARGLPTDAPISTAGQDILGRTGFAGELAEVIANQYTKESLVLALRGDWGSGKSSLKNLIVEVLRERFPKQVKVVEFNPWQWGADETISRAFFREIAAALGQADYSLMGRRRAYKFREYAKVLTSLSGTLMLAGDKTSTVVGWLGSIGLLTAGAGLVLPGLPVTKVAAALLMAGGAATLAAKVIGALGVERDLGKPLEFVRADLEERLKSLPRNLLVVVDDIDRLEPEQIRLVVRLVKSNANLPRITYLLLFQRSIVEEALNPLSAEDGCRYLEKIVQASFDVPVVEGARVEAAVLNGLDKLLSGELTAQNGFDQTRWGNVWRGGLHKLFRNLRDVQRFLADLNVHLNLHRGSRFLEVNVVDFIAIETLRVFEPDVFTAISCAKGLLTGESNPPEAMRARILKITAGLSDDRRDALNIVLKQLFPSFGWALDSLHYGPDLNAEWLKERRICSQRHFDRYFMLRLPDGQISDSEFRDFLELNDKTKISEAFDDLDKRALLPVLLARLDEIKKQLPIENISALLPALIDIGDTYEDSKGFSLSTPFIATWRTAAWYLRGVTDIDRRGRVFLEAMHNSTGLAVPAILIGLEDDRREKKASDKERSLSDADLVSAKDLLLQKIRKASSVQQVFIANLHLVSLLYAWKKLTGEEEPRAWMDNIVEDPVLLPKLLNAFTFTRQSHTFGDYVTRSSRVVKLGILKTFADLNKVDDKIKRLDVSTLADADAEAIAAYNAARSAPDGADHDVE